jgi:UDP-3-O-[3-hydroxymyristoyl] glucosamine N-acyltransferase
MPAYSLGRIAAELGQESPADADLTIRGVCELGDGREDHIAFADGEQYTEQVRACRAALILVPSAFPELPGQRLWRVEQPRLVFLKIAELFVEQPGHAGIHPDASIHPDALLAEDVSVGPCAVIGAGAQIGAGVRIGPGVHVAEGVKVGENCVLESNASLLSGTVLGDRVIVRASASIASEGFGFAWMGDHHHRIPQLGRVEIGDDVEIGCNSCVDRATLGVTRIGRGSKIDNQVHVAHNCQIGEHVLLLAQAVLAGSVRVGSHSILSGQTGVLDHVNIGSRVKVGGRSGVTKDIADDESVWGWPARNIKRVMRERAAMAKLPELAKQVKEMQRQIDALQAQLDSSGKAEPGK